MTIDILTLFPSMFSGPFDESIINIAREKGLVEINIRNLREWSKDKHKKVDDRPYGGGPGMVLMPQPIFDAVDELRGKKFSHSEQRKVILLSPQGQLFNQAKTQQLSGLDHIILICGHYEGVDERVRKHLVDEEISIGNYVLTGGELPAMVVTDAVTRLLPGVLNKESLQHESFRAPTSTTNKQQSPSKAPCRSSGRGRPMNKAGQEADNQQDSKTANTRGGGPVSPPASWLEYPQYTRPANFRDMKVPEMLLSGNHEEIAEWRRKKAVEKTKEKRPELLN